MRTGLPKKDRKKNVRRYQKDNAVPLCRSRVIVLIVAKIVTWHVDVWDAVDERLAEQPEEADAVDKIRGHKEFCIGNVGDAC